MPDHPGAFVALGRDCIEGGGDRLIHGMVLMVACHLFDDGITIDLKHHEVADQVEEVSGFKHPSDDHFQIGGVGWGDVDAVDGASGHEAFAVGGEGANAGGEAIGDDQGFVVGEEAGDIFFVGLELVEGGGNVGVFGCSVFQFQDGEGDPVDEEDNVGAAVLVFDDGELVYG